MKSFLYFLSLDNSFMLLSLFLFFFFNDTATTEIYTLSLHDALPIRHCHWRGDQFSGARDVGLAGGAGEQSVVADAMEPLRQNVEQEAPDELVGRERHGAVPRLPVLAVVLVTEGHGNGRSRRARRGRPAGGSRWRRGGCSGRDRRAPLRARRRAAWRRRTSSSS